MSKAHRIRLEPPTPSSLSDHIAAFLSAVDFSEPAILLLLASHVVLFAVALRVREGGVGHGVLFGYLIGACFGMTYVNRVLGRNWEKVVRQNYFDESGVFLSVMVGLPYLGICLMLVVGDR